MATPCEQDQEPRLNNEEYAGSRVEKCVTGTASMAAILGNHEEAAFSIQESACLNVERTASSTDGEIVCANDENTTAVACSSDENIPSFNEEESGRSIDGEIACFKPEQTASLKNEETACSNDDSAACTVNEETAFSIDKNIPSLNDEEGGVSIDAEIVFFKQEQPANSKSEETAPKLNEETAFSIDDKITCSSDENTPSLNDEESGRSIARSNDDNAACIINEETSMDGKIACSSDENIPCLNDEESGPSIDGEIACFKPEQPASFKNEETAFSNDGKIASSYDENVQSSNEEESGRSIEGEIGCFKTEQPASSKNAETACLNDDNDVNEETAFSIDGKIACSYDENIQSLNEGESGRSIEGESACFKTEQPASLKNEETACSHVEKSELNPDFMKAILEDRTPLTWESQTHEPFTLMPIPEDGTEYSYINRLFKVSAPSYSIIKIERIENPYLLAQYLLKQEKLQELMGVAPEKRLFHGTRRLYAENICKTNFDWRRCGSTKGVKFGQGVSFAPQAYYATHSAPDKVMILAQVSVNRCTVGNCFTAIPPVPFDTTTNGKGTVYVKYEDGDFYPQYLIYFQHTIFGV